MNTPSFSPQPDRDVARLRRELTLAWQLLVKEIAEYKEKVDALEKPTNQGHWIYVSDFGAKADGVTPADSAFANAFAEAGEGGVVVMDAGTYVINSVLFPSEVTLRGAGSQSTVLSHTGTGYCLATDSPGTRTFNQQFLDFQITLNASSVGGIDMTDVSLAYVRNVVVLSNVQGVGLGFHIESSTSGFGVYNRFDHCRALSTGTGFDVATIGSNDTHFTDCRATNCDIGISIVNSNHCVVDTCAIEDCDVGVYIEATSNAIADASTIKHTRFEGNATANIQYGGTAAFTRHAIRQGNHHVTGTATSGSPLYARAQDIETTRGLAISVPISDTPFLLERTAQGGTNLPALLVLDSSVAGGTPNTVQSAAARHAGNVFSGGFWNAGTYTEEFAVTADGDMTAASLTCVDIDVTGDITCSPSSLVILGDGSTAGSPSISVQKSDTLNSVWLQMRVGTASTGLRWSEQFTTSENVDGLVYSGGSALAIRAYRKLYSSTNGRAGWAVNRLYGDLGTATTSSQFSASAGLGAGATTVPDAASRDIRGEVTVTIGAGPAVNPTVVHTDANGAWAAAPFVQATLVGGTGLAAGTITRITQTRTSTATTWTLVGTPIAGETYVISWLKVG